MPKQAKQSKADQKGGDEIADDHQRHRHTKKYRSQNYECDR